MRRTIKDVNTEFYYTLFALYLVEHYDMNQEQILEMWTWVEKKSRSIVNGRMSYMKLKDKLEDLAFVRCITND